MYLLLYLHGHTKKGFIENRILRVENSSRLRDITFFTFCLPIKYFILFYLINCFFFFIILPIRVYVNYCGISINIFRVYDKCALISTNIFFFLYPNSNLF